MAKATLNKNGIATKAGDITVYNYASSTGEYLSVSVEYLPVGVGIPADSCTDAPPVKKVVLLFAVIWVVVSGSMSKTTGAR